MVDYMMTSGMHLGDPAGHVEVNVQLTRLLGIMSDSTGYMRWISQSDKGEGMCGVRAGSCLTERSEQARAYYIYAQALK